MLRQRLLSLLGSEPSASGQGTPRLARASTTLHGLQPEALLARAPGMPRCFWESGDTWSATVGQAARIEVRITPGTNGTDEPSTPDQRIEHLAPEQAHERLDHVARMAAALTERVHHVDTELPPPRFYGGLSFHARHQGREDWTAFPSAHFLLPALELSADAHGTRLTFNALTHGESRRATLERAEAGLEKATRILEQALTSATVNPVPDLVEANGRKAWGHAIQEALETIGEGALEKVVLARCMEAHASGRPDPITVLDRLRHANPGTHRFLVEPQPGSAFLGAAPELVARVQAGTFHASAVAGSIARGSTPEADDALARELQDSEKDRAEHQLVVDHMAERLEALSNRVEVQPRPHVLRLSGIQHLETDVFAELTEDHHVLHVLEALHPTPAVCGTPRDQAKAFLQRTEPFERGWYAGPVGWFDAHGDGAFAPGLRSAVLQQATWHLYAGAGIVAGSEAEKEWDETGIKFGPMLEALGVDA
ncbi:MAG: isochorismate synthase, partial [Candidatus Thermoplasmatota archaeon]|nr:isochorismate synthase [Candidatus Thermoplasmatota archaeon]